MPTNIYLDYNATCPLLPQAQAAMVEVLAQPLNPSSTHAFGRTAKKHLEDARRVIANAVSAFANEVIFTSGGTEANNLALRGVKAPAVLVAATEHASVLQAVPNAQRLAVNPNGLLDLAALDKALKAAPNALVSVMLVNNETGVIQPIAEITRIVRAAGGLLHVDASQALGKIPVDMGALGADMLTLCAHKFGGPQGAGALVVQQKLAVAAQMLGGGQELRRRAGTENLVGIVGFAAAVQHAPNLAHLATWRDAMEAELKAQGAEIYGAHAPRVGNTSSIRMVGISNETQLMHFDLSGVAVSAGSACSSGRVEASHVLTAMGAGDGASQTIRVSMGWNTQESDLQAFVAAWKALRERTKK